MFPITKLNPPLFEPLGRSYYSEYITDQELCLKIVTYQARRSHGLGEKLMDRTAPVWMGNIEGREDLSTSSTASSASISSWIKAVSKIVMIPFWEATAQISSAVFMISAPEQDEILLARNV